MKVRPIEYLLVTYSDRLGVSMVPEMERLAETGVIRLLDLACVRKLASGTVLRTDRRDLVGFQPFEALTLEMKGLIGEGDLQYVADALAPNSFALMVVWEDPWAAPLFEAVRKAGSSLLEGGRVPDEP